MLNLTEEDFTQAIEKGTVVVDFFAVWCGPCRTLAPQFERWATKFTDVKFAKVDIENAQQITGSLSINYLPTVIVFKDGIETRRVVGIPSEAEITEAIKS